MKRCLLFLLPALLALPLVVWASGWLSPEQALSWMEHQQRLQIVDLRHVDDYHQATMKGAIHVSKDELDAMPPDAKAQLLIITDTAVNVVALSEKFAAVKRIRFDFKTWQQAGLPMVRFITKPAFIIPRGLCEMNTPADSHPAAFIKEAL